MIDLHYQTTAQVDERTREAVYEQLKTFNQTANPEFWARLDTEEGREAPLNVVAFDIDGQVAGGLFAETQLSWLKVSVMAVRIDLRGRGIGTELLQRAEREAVRRGCQYAFVDTMSYQAPGFYQKLGYRVAGQIEDWDSHGHPKYYLTKQLSSSGG
jgi:predicted N-acetyltransferase YhbS